MHHDSSILGGQGPFSTLDELFNVYYVTIFRSLLCEPDHDWLGEVCVCVCWIQKRNIVLFAPTAIHSCNTDTLNKKQVLSSPKAEPKVYVNQ